MENVELVLPILAKSDMFFCYVVNLKETHFRKACQTSKMKYFSKPLTIFPKSLHLTCLTGFWIRLFLLYLKNFKRGTARQAHPGFHLKALPQCHLT